MAMEAHPVQTQSYVLVRLWLPAAAPPGPLSEGKRSWHTKAGRMAPPLKVFWGKFPVFLTPSCDTATKQLPAAHLLCARL